jgi:hypothetical protein
MASGFIEMRCTMGRRIQKASSSNERRKSAGAQGVGLLQELTEVAYSYYLQVLDQARLQFYLSLALTSSAFIVEILWLLISKSISPSLALSLTVNPVLAYTCFLAGRTLRRADEISRLILAISLAAKLIDNPEVRNSTLSNLTKQLVGPHSLTTRKGHKEEDIDELIAGVIEDHLKRNDGRFAETAKKDNFAA